MLRDLCQPQPRSASLVHVILTVSNIPVSGFRVSVHCVSACEAYSLEGVVVILLLFVCSCAYISRIPRLKSFLLSEKKGFWGLFRKGAVIGVRLHWHTGLCCAAMACFLLTR